MKEFTFEEFNDRLGAVQRAQRIFIESGLTNNITKAFQIYQEVFAERDRELFITAQREGPHQKTFMDRYERPLCPECGAALLFRIIPENSEGIKTQLICSKPECDTLLNSDQDISWWMGQLKKK